MHTGVKAELKAVARISGDMLYSKKKTGTETKSEQSSEQQPGTDVSLSVILSLRMHATFLNFALPADSKNTLGKSVLTVYVMYISPLIITSFSHHYSFSE